MVIEYYAEVELGHSGLVHSFHSAVMGSNPSIYEIIRPLDR